MARSEISTPSLQIQPRDQAMLRGLFESRLMTTQHAAALFFDGKQEAAKKRLQKIKAAGLIGERPRRVNEPAILFLTRKAFGILRDEGWVSQYPIRSIDSFERRGRVSALTIRHELEVMDVKTSFHCAVAKTGQFSVSEFITWPLLCQFQAFRTGQGAAEVLVKPDGFIRINEREPDGGLSEHAFFLEVDRSSETQETLVTRAACYLDYYRSGGFARLNGGDPTAYKEYPFRVLIVLKTAERRNNTAERLLQNNPPILRQVYLSTMKELTAGPLDAVWIRPLDYREATAATPYEPGRQKRTWAYRRTPAREEFVEARIRKHRILVDDPAV